MEVCFLILLNGLRKTWPPAFFAAFIIIKFPGLSVQSIALHRPHLLPCLPLPHVQAELGVVVPELPTGAEGPPLVGVLCIAGGHPHFYLNTIITSNICLCVGWRLYSRNQYFKNRAQNWHFMSLNLETGSETSAFETEFRAGLDFLDPFFLSKFFLEGWGWGLRGTRSQCWDVNPLLLYVRPVAVQHIINPSKT